MHPKFRRYLDGREPEESLRLRVGSEEKALLSDILKVEGGEITELLIEGIWRVVGSRRLLSGQSIPLVTRPRQLKNTTLSVRLSDAETIALREIAIGEKRSLGDLIGEGIWRVLISREQNKDYQAKARQILIHLNEVEAMRATLHEQVQ